jgi:formate/nitrite transporter FocA (FNT family)
MYFIPAGLLIKSDDTWLASADLPSGIGGLSWRSFIEDNLAPVTIGNIVGGALMVGAVYWFVYLRRGSRQAHS